VRVPSARLLRRVRGRSPLAAERAAVTWFRCDDIRADILARNCALPVSAARHGAALRAGTVAVVPPGKHALVTTGSRLALISTDHTPPYRPSADLLLTSLALVAARRTIAVILSGAGNDGATGTVHDFGGTVIAADEASSAYFAMPEAAISRDDAVDYVLPADDIPALLVSLTGGAAGQVLLSGDTGHGLPGGDVAG